MKPFWRIFGAMTIAAALSFRAFDSPAISVFAPTAKAATNPFTLSPLETRVLGQSAWLRGGPAALRVIVSNHQTGQSMQANVKLSLVNVSGKKPGASLALFQGRTTALGTLDARFVAPAAAPGTYQLRVAVDSPLGTDELRQNIQLEEATQVLLTCDKPVYQPGQTMHLRALALDKATRQAVAGQVLTFEVEDGRGNKVFKQHETLSAFGVAGCDFVLADEVNRGTFTLRTVLGDGQTEKKVHVERYVLPKYKVSLTTDKPYYLPGETVQGTLEAHYFFGKPVSGADLTLAVNTIDIGVTKLDEINGTTDADGKYQFSYTLPTSFVGQPFEQGKAVVEFAGTLKDTADQKQDVHMSVPVVKDPISLVIVPESAALVPGIPNRVYIAAATPDGQPLKQASLLVSVDGGGAAQLTTDDLGLATYLFTAGDHAAQIRVQAMDAAGRSADATQRLDVVPSDGGVILRADKTLAKVGDRLHLAGLSSIKRGTLYLDVIRDKQTILTEAQDLQNGQAQFSLPLTPDMAGTLEIHAYTILPNEDIIRDSRVIVVSPADDLHVTMTADRDEYRPGGDATLRFTVQDGQAHPVSAALGLAIVDESVFALSELQPGLEKVYFTLEKELMEPKYEIHGLTPVGLLEPQPTTVIGNAARQRAAAIIFAAAPAQTDFDYKLNSYQIRSEKIRDTATALMVKEHETILQAVAKYETKAHSPLSAAQSLDLLVANGYLKVSDLTDPWGHWYRANLYGNTNYNAYFTLSSAGPDGRWGTADDIADVGQNRFVAFDGIARRGNLAMAKADVVDRPVRMFEDMAGTPGAVPLPMMAAAPPVISSPEIPKPPGNGGADAPRVRSYFPETMYWNPALITDANGQAEVHVPLADSITTWRVSMVGSTQTGQLGSATAPLKVFQDFFVDMDLPISLTQGDNVSIPVTVYNYLPQAQDVTLTLAPESWFTLTGDGHQGIHMESNQVKVVYFPITVDKIGSFPLTITAQGTHASDAVRRVIDVLPNGREIRTTINDTLTGQVDKTVTLPANAVAGASTIWVKLYPGTFSQVVEGLDGVLQMPGGCFEQTSSSTYPDVLVLDYLKQNKKINPELQMKADQYINIGYQRLVTFECKNGGFSWFGDEPAHQILTAYGLLEFSDMARVHDVDPAVIHRTQEWLASKQKGDGTWQETNQGIQEGIINRQTGALRTTAYVAWALAESGYDGPQVASGVAYVKAHMDEAKDPYTLAVILNLLAKTDKNGDATDQAANKLIALAKTTDKLAYWQSETQTFTGANGQGADTETTGLAAFGLLKWGRNAGFVNKVLARLVQSKDSYGTWGSTQGTVWSLKSLLYASRYAVGGGRGTVTVVANGQQAASFSITPDDSDVMRQIDLAKFVKDGTNAIHLDYNGEGSLLYQIVGRYYLPWSTFPAQAKALAPLSIKVAYDKTTLAQDDVATVTATIHNNTNKIAEMPLIDLGVPPGFSVISDKLDAAAQAKTISKYTVAARQIIVYLEKLSPDQTVTLTYQIRAKYPIKTRTPESKVYPYYNPERVAISAPQEIVTRK